MSYPIISLIIAFIGIFILWTGWFGGWWLKKEDAEDMALNSAIILLLSFVWPILILVAAIVSVAKLLAMFINAIIDAVNGVQKPRDT